MNVLLDTHAFLWFISGDTKLSGQGRREIENPGNRKLVSVATLWEIAIKSSLGKITLAAPFESFIAEQMERNGFDLIHIQLAHTAGVASLPFHHRDPFDRILIAQCLCDDLFVISKDPVFDDYSVRRIW